MTCIAAVAHEGNVWMGADSAGVAGLALAVRRDPKIYRVGDFLFLSGIGPRVRGSKEIPGVTLDSAGNIASYDIETQCRVVFENVRLVLEDAGSIVFMHRVAAGSATKSYGIHVAKLAGVPETVLARAATVLAGLESLHHRHQKMVPVPVERSMVEPKRKKIKASGPSLFGVATDEFANP